MTGHTQCFYETWLPPASVMNISEVVVLLLLVVEIVFKLQDTIHYGNYIVRCTVGNNTLLLAYKNTNNVSARKLHKSTLKLIHGLRKRSCQYKDNI